MYIYDERIQEMESLVFNSIVTVRYSFTSYTVTLRHLLAILALTLLYSENQPHSPLITLCSTGP